MGHMPHDYRYLQQDRQMSDKKDVSLDKANTPITKQEYRPANLDYALGRYHRSFVFS